MKNVETKLIEMKNKSELMLDLAYSALLYHNRDIAKEVIELEDQINHLYDYIQREAIEKCKDEVDTDRSLILIKMADAIERFADCALDIADVVLRDIDLHPVIKKSLEESDVVMLKKMVNKSSYLDGKTIGETKIASEIGMWIVAVKRGINWYYGPKKDFQFEDGDIIFVRGPEDSEQKLNSWVGGG
ncbi:MAG: potassium channel family protein [Thermoplasmatota archaeon]